MGASRPEDVPRKKVIRYAKLIALIDPKANTSTPERETALRQVAKLEADEPLIRLAYAEYILNPEGRETAREARRAQAASNGAPSVGDVLRSFMEMYGPRLAEAANRGVESAAAEIVNTVDDIVSAAGAVTDEESDVDFGQRDWAQVKPDTLPELLDDDDVVHVIEHFVGPMEDDDASELGDVVHIDMVVRAGFLDRLTQSGTLARHFLYALLHEYED